ncbi:hypothetical protein MrNuV_ORF056 [Macrobrachium rosenbergii nudivirus]|nr:hypothetical protein MrNuV_ORF056 [Macrobrachium rosenbergii nudivirus]
MVKDKPVSFYNERIDNAFDNIGLPEDDSNCCFICRFIINIQIQEDIIATIKHSLKVNNKPIKPDDWLKFKGVDDSHNNVPNFTRICNVIIMYFSEDNEEMRHERKLVKQLLDNVDELKIYELTSADVKDFNILPRYSQENKRIKDLFQVRVHSRYTHCLSLDLDTILTIPLYDFIIIQSEYYLKFEKRYMQDIVNSIWIAQEDKKQKIADLYFNPIFLHMNKRYIFLYCDDYVDSNAASLDACLTLCNYGDVHYDSARNLLCVDDFERLDVDYFKYKDCCNFLNPMIIRNKQNSIHSSAINAINWEYYYNTEIKPYFEKTERFKHLMSYILECGKLINSLRIAFPTTEKFDNENERLFKYYASVNPNYNPIDI